MAWTAADAYKEGLTFFSTVVDGTAPQQWTNDSPCAGWSALDVLGHVGEATSMGLRILRGDEISFTRHDPPSSVVAGDPGEWWHELAAQALDVFGGEIDLDREVDSPMGRRTVGEGLSFPSVDLFIHGWDLATATGRTVTIPDEAIAFTRGLFAHVPVEASRRPGVMGDERVAPAGANPTEALIAFTGRDPHWSSAQH